MRNPGFFYFTVASIAVIAATSVFAVGPRETNYSERFNAIDRTPSSTVIQGSLICQMGESNTGSGCDIKLKESATGVVYSLENAGTVRKFFNDGVREVAVTGTRTGDASFKVSNAKAR